MAETLCKDVCLWVKDVGCRQTRVTLLSLEPGSRIWISVEGEPIQFERMADGSDGRSTRGFRPVGLTADRWLRRYRESRGELVEIELTERPLDEGKAGSGYYQREQV